MDSLAISLGAHNDTYRINCIRYCPSKIPIAKNPKIAMPMLTGLALSHSQTVKFEKCSPPHLIWEIVTQGQRILDRQMVHQWCAAVLGILPMVSLR